MKTPPADHWLKYVWNIMRAETDAVSFEDNRVSFVTFNYDRLIEFYFDTVLSHAFSLTQDQARTVRESIPVIHLHGQIEGQPFGEFTIPLFPTTTDEIARGIRIIHESMPKDDPNFDEAYECIREATRVVLVGLGYHPENVRRLQLNSLMKDNAYLFGTAFNLGQAEIQVAQNRIGRNLRTGRADEKAEKFMREHVPLD